MKKKLLSLSAILLLLVTLVFSASAVTIKEFNTKSTFTPVTYGTHKATTDVTLYGNADYLCMKAYSETKNEEYFCIEIYSDSKRTKQILSYSNTFKKGTTYEDIFFDLTELKSKTYYATSYVIKKSSLLPPYSNNMKKDPDTVKKFKIIVKRDGTSIKNMKCIAYGYENTFYGPAVYWYSVPGATKYYVYKYTDGKYKKIATVNANNEEFSFYVDETLKSKNVTRYYKIKAVKGSSATPLSEKLKVVTLKAPTVKAQLNQSGGNGIKVTWSKPKSGCTYTVYRAVNDGDWKELTTTSSTTYYDTSAKSGYVYYYTVIAKNGNNISGYDPYGAGCLYVGIPTISKIEKEEDSLVVSWKAISKAENYKVYRKQYEDKDWTYIGETSETSFIDNAVEKNTPYYYTVRAEIAETLSWYRPKSTPAAIFEVPLLNEIETNEKGQAVVSWEGTEGLRYAVCRKEEGGKWQEIDIVKGNSFNDTTTYLSNGKKYYYTVKPCLLVQIVDDLDPYEDYIYGDYDNEGKEFYYYAPISNLSVIGTISGVELSWTEIGNVNGYNIYRKTAESEYELIGTSEKAAFEDSTLLPETEYTYKVTYNVGEEEKSELSTEKVVKLSSETVSLSDEIKVYSKYSSSWSLSIKDFDPEDTYRVYVRTPEGWELYGSQKTSDGTFGLGGDKAKEKNEYAITAVKKDGTVTLIPENGFILDPFEFSVTFEIDQENCAAIFSWEAIDGAEKYNIYDNYFKFIMSVDGDKTSAVIPSLETAKSYNYFVSAVKDGTEIKVPTEYKYLYATPTITSVTVEAEGVRIKWDSRGLGSIYQIYRKASPDAAWAKIGEARATIAYVDKTAKDGITYYYAVITGDEDTGKFSAFPEEGTKFAYIRPTTISKVAYGKNYVKITWKKSAAADSYQIYRKEGSGSWKLLRTTDDGDEVTYTDKKVKAGTKYTYSIRVCKDGERSEGAKKTLTFLAAPTKVKVKVSNTVPVITFEKSKGATQHYIYRKVGNGSWKKIATVNAQYAKYSDFDVGSGKIYYCVKAYNGGNLSVASETVSIKK